MLTFFIALGFFDGVSVPVRTYPLAGVSQDYPLAGVAQTYPLRAA